MQTRVRFVEDESKALTILEIRTPLKHPLSQDIERRLKRLAIQVVHSETRMASGGVEQTLHVAELDGKPLTQKRRLELQTLLLSRASPSETPPAPIAAASSTENANAESDAGSTTD